MSLGCAILTSQLALAQDLTSPASGWSETEILAAYGEPDYRNPVPSEQDPGIYRQSWVYSELGLTFRFESETETGPYTLVSMRFVEDLGPLSLRMLAPDILEALGQPDSRGDMQYWEATGTFVQTWVYETLGLTLEMETRTKDRPARLMMWTAGEGCQLLTSRDIGVGSTEEEVREAYGEYEAFDAPPNSDSFVAGSIYGGVIFRFSEGQVTSIFFGVAAE